MTLKIDRGRTIGGGQTVSIEMMRQRGLSRRPGFTKGRCPDCRRVYMWKGAPRLRDALCPVDRRHGRLIQTSWRVQGYVWVDRTPLVRLA